MLLISLRQQLRSSLDRVLPGSDAKALDGLDGWHLSAVFEASSACIACCVSEDGDSGGY